MKLPNADQAIIDLDKLQNYCLNIEHPRGKHKAKVFESVLGLTSDYADELRCLILAGIISEDCEVGELDEFGQRFTVDVPITTAKGTATIRTAWIVRTQEKEPRLTTCYVK